MIYRSVMYEKPKQKKKNQQKPSLALIHKFPYIEFLFSVLHDIFSQ